MRARYRAWFMCSVMAACGPYGAAAATPAFDRLAARVRDVRGYAMRVDSHEERGDRSEDVSYRYARAAGAGAAGSVDVTIEQGRGAGTRLAYRGGDRIAIRAPGLPVRANVAVDDPRIATLRGTSTLASGLEPFVACATAHPAALSERRGPDLAAVPTVALVLDRRGIACPRDTKQDAELTFDVLYVSQTAGIPLLRKCFAGREIVVRWRIRDFATGP